MKLAEIIKTVTVNEIIGDAEREITDIQIDSRHKPTDTPIYKKQLRTEHALSYANSSPKKSDGT